MERDLLSKLGADLTKLCSRSAGRRRVPRSRDIDIEDGPHVLPLVVVDDESSSDGTLRRNFFRLNWGNKNLCKNFFADFFIFIDLT